jgi:RimJ/RimL family protein N-acetyltransferase
MPQITSRSGKYITLRPPQFGDESILLTYAQTLQAEDIYVLLNPTMPVSLIEEQNYLRESLNKIAANWQVHYLAFHDGQMIGSTQITKLGRRKMHVGSFGISLAANYRHDGIGESLARFMLEEASTKLSLRLITLEVFSDNICAQKLYQKLGFIEYGRIPKGLQYKEGFNDAICMYKSL